MNKPDPPIFTRAALAVLIVASGLAPLATASYLPALPLAQTSLGATPVSMQFTLTATIVGVALGQLVFGPLSDRTGRKGALLVGVALFVIAGLAIAVSPNVGWMIGWRFVQGVGAGAGMVLGRAVVADRARGIAVAKLLGVMMAIGVVVPAVAPLFGILMLNLSSWAGIFAALAGLGVLLALAAVLWLPETRVRHDGRAPRAGSQAGRAWAPFLAYTAAIASTFSAMYATISAGPYLYQGQFGFSPTGYALVSAATALGIGAVTFFGTRRLGADSRFGVLTPVRVTGAALVALALGSLLVGVTLLVDPPVWGWIAALAVATLPVGLATGCLMGLGMGSAPLQPGAASAVLGVVPAAGGAAMPPLMGLGGEQPATVMTLALVTCAVLALVTFSVGARLAGTPEPA